MSNNQPMVQVEIGVEELRKRKIFIAIPMYGGQCHGSTAHSLIQLQKLCTNYGVDIKYFFLFNESLIPRARNYAVDEFLRQPEYTHFMFIDADIGFDPNDVLCLAALVGDDSPYDVLCAPYPKKTIAWEKIKRAVDKGFADENPHALQNYVGDFVFNPAPGQTEISLTEPVEVMESGTGFMMIRRNTFEKYANAYPELHYKPDHIRQANFDGEREIVAFFDTVIDPKSKRYLSEDYMFCQYARKIGLKIWLCPWMRLTHFGNMPFGGSLFDLAQIGAAATADPNEKLK